MSAIATAAGLYVIIQSNRTEQQWSEYQREKYADYIAVEGRISRVWVEQDKTKRYNTYLSVDFTDPQGNPQKVKIKDNKAAGAEKDHDITIYYDPENPTEATSERIYREAMRPSRWRINIP